MDALLNNSDALLVHDAHRQLGVANPLSSAQTGYTLSDTGFAKPIDCAHREYDAHHPPGAVEPLRRARIDSDTHQVPGVSDPLPQLIYLWRLREDFVRARQRIDMQGGSICRRFSKGDKAAGAKLWTEIKSGKSLHLVAITHAEIVDSNQSFSRKIADLEKQISRQVGGHQLAPWSESVRGLGALTLAGLLCEAGRPITDYRTVSCLWKRMGLAVINGERQRKCADAKKAILHGYSPSRAAFMIGVIASNLIRAQGKSETAGPYRLIYDARKASTEAKGWTLAHRENDARRIMVKALLKDLWVSARNIERGEP